MSDYHRLLAQEDSRAREDYDYDPRVAYHMQSTILREHLTPANQGGQGGRDLMDPSSFSREPEGSRSDSNSVQAAPKTTLTKRYIVVDCAQRDWTVYPNPYSNLTFTFGGQGATRTPVPVYANNPTYPSFALAPTGSTGFTPTPGASNLRGFSYIDPTGLQVDVSAYNPNLLKGQFISFDASINNTAGSGDAFGTAMTPCNVGAIRLVRAILPQTPFVSYPSDPVFAVDASDAKASAAATPYNTFGTYPYLLFYLNEYRGQYYGPTEACRKAFSVLTQCNRAQLDFTLTNGPQYFDYTPWNNEALRFQSPLTSLQKLQINVTDPNGTPFAVDQPDNMQIDSIRLATAVSVSGNTSNVVVSRSTLICTTPAYKKFPETQLRVGDRVTFYKPTLDAIFNSPGLAQNPAKQQFVNALMDQSFPVLFVKTYKFDVSLNTYVPDASANAVSLTDSRIDYFNAFFIPNFVNRLDNGTLEDKYPNAVDASLNNYSIIDVQTILGVGKSLPILNVTQQPVYTFELDIVTPDTSQIGGTLVN